MSLQRREESVEESGRSGAWGSGIPEEPAILEPGPQMLRLFSHRCRNSLHGIKLGLYLLKRDLHDPLHGRWKDLVRTYDEIEKLFVGLERIYQSRLLTLIRSPLGHLFAERLPLWRVRYPEWGHTIVLDPPDQELPGDFDPSHLGVGLDRFVAWRAESGASAPPPRVEDRRTEFRDRLARVARPHRESRRPRP